MYTHKASRKMKNTKVQRAMEKILGRKENIGLQMPGSVSWTQKCKGHCWKNYWGEKKHLPPNTGQQKLDT